MTGTVYEYCNKNEQVYLRLRGGRIAPSPERCVDPSPYDERSVITPLAGGSRTWRFDGVMDEHCSQQRVYDEVAKEFVPSVFEGKSAAVMCYGQVHVCR